MINTKYNFYRSVFIACFLIALFGLFNSTQAALVFSSCLDLKYNMGYGSTDAQTAGGVTALQKMLAENGYLKSGTTGFYGLLTKAAVMNAQKDYGVIQTGYVGPITREKLKTMSCGSNTVVSPQPTPATSSPVIITKPPLNGTIIRSCIPNPSLAKVGQEVQWSVLVDGGDGKYVYNWSGTDGLSGTTKLVAKTYSTAGTKKGKVTVTSGGITSTADCLLDLIVYEKDAVASVTKSVLETSADRGLIATINFTLKAGDQPAYIFGEYMLQSNGGKIDFIDQSGKVFTIENPVLYKGTEKVSTAKVSAGSSQSFKLVGKISALPVGTYYASLRSITLGSTSSLGTGYEYTLPTNKSNTQVVR